MVVSLSRSSLEVCQEIREADAPLVREVEDGVEPRTLRLSIVFCAPRQAHADHRGDELGESGVFDSYGHGEHGAPPTRFPRLEVLEEQSLATQSAPSHPSAVMSAVDALQG